MRGEGYIFLLMSRFQFWNFENLEGVLNFSKISKLKIALRQHSKLKNKLFFAKLSSTWLVQLNFAELRFALYLIITTPTPRIVVISIEINILRLLAVVRV